MMRIRHLQLIPDVIKEIRGLTGKTSIEEIVMTEDMIAYVLPEIEKKGIIEKCNASVAKSLITSGEISLRRRVSERHLKKRLVMSP